MILYDIELDAEEIIEAIEDYLYNKKDIHTGITIKKIEIQNHRPDNEIIISKENGFINCLIEFKELK